MIEEEGDQNSANKIETQKEKISENSGALNNKENEQKSESSDESSSDILDELCDTKCKK